MMAQQFGRREQILLGVLLGLGVVYLFWTYVLSKQVEAFKDNREDLKQITTTLEQGRVKVASLPREKLRLAAAQEKLSLLEQEFTNDLQDGAILLDIGLDDSLKDSLKVTLVQPGDAISKGEYLELPFRFTVTGDYLKVLEFLKKLENLPNI